MVRLLVALVLVAAGLAPPWAAALAADGSTPSGGFDVIVERVDGTTVRGPLAAITAHEVRLAGDPGAIQVADVRRVLRAEVDAADPGTVLVELADGSRIGADDVGVTSEAATVRRGGEAAVLPATAVRSVSFRGADAAGRRWRDVVPARPESDVVVVGAGEALECVACAIETVAADSVTVLLDGERIPVARNRVAGLVWLREPVAPGGVRLRVAGGELAADVATWSPEALLLDGATRLPAAWLRSIDYAAGRVVRLADVAAERTAVEPHFAGLAQVDGLAAFLGPRVVVPDAAAAARDLVIRPRTVVTWQVPARSRRFRATLVAAAWGRSTGRASVVLAIDGREVARAVVDAAAREPRADATLGADVSGAARLTLTVEIAADGGLGCPVRLIDPVFER